MKCKYRFETNFNQGNLLVYCGPFDFLTLVVSVRRSNICVLPSCTVDHESGLRNVRIDLKLLATEATCSFIARFLSAIFGPMWANPDRLCMYRKPKLNDIIQIATNGTNAQAAFEQLS